MLHIHPVPDNPGMINKCYYFLQCVNIDYGMENDNPINNLRFYRKDFENQAIKLPVNEVGLGI